VTGARGAPPGRCVRARAAAARALPGPGHLPRQRERGQRQQQRGGAGRLCLAPGAVPGARLCLLWARTLTHLLQARACGRGRLAIHRAGPPRRMSARALPHPSGPAPTSCLGMVSSATRCGLTQPAGSSVPAFFTVAAGGCNRAGSAPTPGPARRWDPLQGDASLRLRSQRALRTVATMSGSTEPGERTPQVACEGAGMAGAFPADPAARYAVRLFFSDYQAAAPGARVFDLTIAGQPALRGFDIIGAGDGARVGVVRTFLVRPCADRTSTGGSAVCRGPALSSQCACFVVCMRATCRQPGPARVRVSRHAERGSKGALKRARMRGRCGRQQTALSRWRSARSPACLSLPRSQSTRTMGRRSRTRSRCPWRTEAPRRRTG